MPKLVRSEVRAPSLATLRKYGLDEPAWREICERQGWRCPICSEPFGDRLLAIDHEHVAGFKARKRRKGKKRGEDGKRIEVRVRVMPPEERSRHVRGVLHSFCNRFVRRWLTIDRAQRILQYLEAHRERCRKSI